MSNSNSAKKTGRPKKGQRAATHPYIAKHPDFPLSYNKSSRQFYKTIQGKRYYFGSDPIEAKKQYEADLSYIVRGEDTPDPDAITVAELFNLWLDHKNKDADAGKIKHRTFRRYRDTAKFIVSKLGRTRAVCKLSPRDFTALHRALDKRYGSSPTVFTFATRVAKSPFLWADEEDIVDKPKMGSFKGASKKQIRVKRRSRGRQHYNADEVRKLLGNANPTLRAAILLGVNGGYTQSEVAQIQTSWIDFDAGFIDQLREKTGVDRRVPLWTETMDALHAMPHPTPSPNAKRRLFLTRTGNTYDADRGDNGIGQMFSRLMKKHKISLEQSGFGKLRATFATVADEALDANAKQLIMGHAIEGGGTGEHYVRTISDGRLRAVTDHVHDWLFKPKK